MKTCKRVIMLALMVTVLVSFCACSKKDYDIKDACDLIESVLDKDREEAIKLFEKSFDIKLENQTEIGNSHTYVSDNIFYVDGIELNSIGINCDKEDKSVCTVSLLNNQCSPELVSAWDEKCVDFLTESYGTPVNTNGRDLKGTGVAYSMTVYQISNDRWLSVSFEKNSSRGQFLLQCTNKDLVGSLKD